MLSSAARQLTPSGYFADVLRLSPFVLSASGGGSDTTPDQFSGQTLAGQALSATVTFDPVTPVGYNAAATITVTNGLYSINGGAYTSSSGTLNPGDYFTPRNTASGSYLTNVDTVVTVGGVSATYRSITLIDPSIVSKNIKIDFGFGFGF